MMHAIYGRREPRDDETLRGPAPLEAWENEGGAEVLVDRRAATLDQRTPLVLQPNHGGERVRALLRIGIATTAIIGLSWTYAHTASQGKQVTTGVRSGNPESSSGLIGGGLRVFRLDAPDDDQPWTNTLRLQGVVEQGTPAAYAECGPEGGVPLVRLW